MSDPRVDYTDPYWGKRVAMFAVTPDFLRTIILTGTDFVERYPEADHIAIHYDFDSDCFWFKFRHPTLPAHEEGARIPFIDPPLFKAQP